MAAAVTIDFKVGGIARVNEAFEGVSKRMTRMEQEALKEAEKAAAARERLIVKETQSKARELTSQQKSAEKTAAAIDRLNANSAKEANKILERRYREAEKYLNDDVIKTERSEAKKTAIAAREEASRTRTVDREAKARQTVAEKTARSRVGTIGNSISGMTSTAITMAGGALALGGGFAIADAVRSDMSLGKAVASLQNNASLAGTKLDRKDIMSKSGVASAKTGISREALIKGWEEYVNLSSDAAGGGRNLNKFATLAKGTGTDFTQLMTMAGNLKVQNRNLSDDGMMTILRNVVGQGGKGAISMKDLAQYGGVITATSGAYAGSQDVNQQRLLGLAQSARRVVDSASSAESVKRFASDISSRVDKGGNVTVGGKKVKVAGKDGLFDPADIIADMLGATGGGANATGLLKKAGVGRESMNLFNAGLLDYKAAGGGKAGTEAARTAMKGLENAGLTQDGVNDLFANTMKESGEKFDLAVTKIKEIIEDRISPYLDKFADMLSKPEFEANVTALINAVGEVAAFFMDNPFIGIGAAVLTKITADVGAAMIGDKIKDSLVKSIATNGSGITAANAVITVAAASLAIASFKAAGDVKDDASNAFDKGGDDSTAGVWGLTKKLNSGTATPQDIEAAKAKKADITKMLGDATADVNSPGYSNSSFRKGINATGEKLGNMVGIGGTERQDDAKARARNEGIVANAANVETALMNLDKALQKVAATAGTATDDNPARKHSMVSFQRGGVP